MNHFARILFLSMLFCIGALHAQDTTNQQSDKDKTQIIPGKMPQWIVESSPLNYLGMEAYANTGNLYKSDSTDLWNGNSFTWEIYYAASIPNYNWISFGAGMEIGGSVGVDQFGTVYDRMLDESFYFVFQAFMNVTPWFTLHFNSDGRIQFRGRYTANFYNAINGNFGHFFLTELQIGFFIPGNEVDVNTGQIDKFWIDSPALEMMYFVQFHKNVALRLFGKLYVNNGLFYNSGITPNEIIPMEWYVRFDFMLGNGISIWTRVQWNIYNSDFNDWAFYPNNNPFDIQLRAGLILILDFTEMAKKSLKVS
ncbi:MAG: hypothetical protein ACRCTQ_04560 [Brevinemataceae bacterium]